MFGGGAAESSNRGNGSSSSALPQANPPSFATTEKPLPPGVFATCANCGARNPWPFISRHRFCDDCREERLPLCSIDGCINLVPEVAVATAAQRCLAHLEINDKIEYLDEVMSAVKTFQEYLATTLHRRERDATITTQTEIHAPDDIAIARATGTPLPPSIKSRVVVPFADGVRVTIEIATPLS
jgi:hypothetical protein